MIEARKSGGAFQSSDSDYKNVLCDIWSAPWVELKRAPWAYGIAIDDDKWTISPDYIHASLSKRMINFNIKFPLHMSAVERVSFRRRLKRIALIYGFVAVYDDDGIGDRLRLRSARKLLAPTSWVQNYRSVLVLAELSLDKFPAGRFPDRCPDGSSLFSHLSLDQMQEIVDRGHSSIVNSYGRLDLQFRTGHFEDWVSGVGVPKRQRTPHRNITQPFEDRELSRFLETSLKLSAASNEVALAFNKYRADSRVALGVKKHSERRDKWLAIATNLNVVAGGIVESSYLTNGKLCLVDPFDRSRVARYLGSMLRAVQMANAGLIAFGSGLRPEELDNLRRDCASKRNGLTYFSGAVFKGDGTAKGVPRDWPLPEIAARALERQNALSKLIEPDRSGLWVDRIKLSGSDSFMSASDRFSQHFRDIVDVDGRSMGDIDSITIYRIRTSAARLVALSIRGGTLAASLTLGHRNMSETVGYYNARGDWDQEFSEVVAQVEEALGKSVISEVKSGVAPRKLQDFIRPLLGVVSEVSLPESGSEVTGEEDIRSAQRALGSTFRIVRKGVLCSSQGWSRGKCSERRGVTDFTKCVSGCNWRFETSALMDDLRHVVDYYLKEWAGFLPEEQLMRSHAATAIVESVVGRDVLIKEYRIRDEYRNFVYDLSDENFNGFSEFVIDFCKEERRTIENI